MSVMVTMDLQAAVIAHLNWKSKLSDFFYGVEELRPADIIDHQNCDFGKWLYSTGLTTLAPFTEVTTLEALHKEVHDKVKELVNMPKATRLGSEGQEVLERFKQRCDQLVELLELVEAKVKKQAAS
jgi:uncharacterized protein YicC (UPF0701 family)